MTNHKKGPAAAAAAASAAKHSQLVLYGPCWNKRNVWPLYCLVQHNEHCHRTRPCNDALKKEQQQQPLFSPSLVSPFLFFSVLPPPFISCLTNYWLTPCHSWCNWASEAQRRERTFYWSCTKQPHQYSCSHLHFLAHLIHSLSWESVTCVLCLMTCESNYCCV